MTKLELEVLVRDIISRVADGYPDEDNFVEMKSEWIPGKKAARILAGHANTARGQQILWLVGVDRRRGVTAFAQEEVSNWWGAVKSEFEGGIYPELLMHINIPIEEKTVVALLFETDRAPYVVKNPAFGSLGEKAELEIPWRDGTSTRSATRAQLVRILTPLQKLPQIEFRGGDLSFYPRNDNRDGNKRLKLDWKVDLTLYIIPRSSAVVTIPIHNCGGWIEFAGCPSTANFDRVCFSRTGLGSSVPSPTISVSDHEAFIEGPGMLTISGWVTTDISQSDPFANVCMTILPLGAEKTLSIKAEFNLRSVPELSESVWMLAEHSIHEQQIN